jgi:hypothetical protein
MKRTWTIIGVADVWTNGGLMQRTSACPLWVRSGLRAVKLSAKYHKYPFHP